MAEFETRSTLLERVRDIRDGHSWQEFVATYEPLLHRFVLARGVPQRDAEDLVQEIFAVLLGALQTFEFDRRRGRFRSWLWQVSRNVMIDWGRRQQRAQRAEREWCERLADLQHDEDAAAQWSALHKQRVIEAVLTRLQQETQAETWACFQEHLQQGRPAAEVAAQLGVTPNVVYVNASRVLARVRDYCRQYDEELSDE